MVKKMFVSLLQWTKGHDEPADDSSAGFQNQKRDLSEKSHDF